MNQFNRSKQGAFDGKSQESFASLSLRDGPPPTVKNALIEMKQNYFKGRT